MLRHAACSQDLVLICAFMLTRDGFLTLATSIPCQDQGMPRPVLCRWTTRALILTPLLSSSPETSLWDSGGRIGWLKRHTVGRLRSSGTHAIPPPGLTPTTPEGHTGGLNLTRPPKTGGGGTSLVGHWPRLRAPNVGALGSILGQGTRCHMPQLRSCMPQQRWKILHSQINNFEKYWRRVCPNPGFPDGPYPPPGSRRWYHSSRHRSQYTPAWPPPSRAPQMPLAEES